LLAQRTKYIVLIDPPLVDDNRAHALAEPVLELERLVDLFLCDQPARDENIAEARPRTKTDVVRRLAFLMPVAIKECDVVGNPRDRGDLADDLVVPGNLDPATHLHEAVLQIHQC